MKNNQDYLITSESVTEGHPDKMADQISDAILDDVMKQDPMGRVAMEALLTNGIVMIAGEMTTNCYVDIPKIARSVIKGIGYNNSSIGFDWETCGISCAIQEQSRDIAQGVDDPNDLDIGAGDQGMMYGYAMRETPELMPLPIVLAHRLAKRLSDVRKSGEIKYLRPDGKSQVTIEYKNSTPTRIQTVLVSAQHDPETKLSDLKKDIINKVMLPILPKKLIDKKLNFS